MAYYKLKMNDEKTEFVIICSPHYWNTYKDLTLHIGDTPISAAQKARNLGVTFDAHLDMKEHVLSVCKGAYAQLRKICSIRKFMTDDAVAQLIHAFVTSRLDYCNSLLASLPDITLRKLQWVQNAAARILTRTRKYDHITPILIDLHWLPIPLRIIFKILLLTYRTLHDLSPEYLKELIIPYEPSRNLRSASTHLLTPVRTRLTTYGDHAFSAVAPKLWNNLPADIRNAGTLDTFKSSLKTHLFKQFTSDPELYVL